MEACPAENRDHYSRLLDPPGSARYDDPSGNCSWKRWLGFARYCGQHPYLIFLQGTSLAVERGRVFMAFARSLREGRHRGTGPGLSGTTIETTLRECSKFMVRRKLADPRRETPGQPNINPDIREFLKTCKKEDPPPRPQLALPSSVIHFIAATFTTSPLASLRTTAHLVVMAFFFLLRVGEYTPSWEPRQTIPLRKKDIRLWRGNTILDNDADLMTLLQADAVTICLENQKNGTRMSTVHHETTGDPVLDPVRSVAHLIFELRDLPDTTPLGTYTYNGKLCQVRARAILALVRLAASSCHLAERGYDMTRIGTHSLRSGGAMALKLAGYDHDMIRKLGRWNSDTYLLYIQTQIGSLTAGVARSMARLTWFRNVG